MAGVRFHTLSKSNLLTLIACCLLVGILGWRTDPGKHQVALAGIMMMLRSPSPLPERVFHMEARDWWLLLRCHRLP